MSYYGIGDKLKVVRKGPDTLEMQIGNEKVTVQTEDMAALVRDNLPDDRAAELFSEMQTREVQSGRVQVQVKAHKNIVKGEIVSFTFDVAKYVGDSKGIRTSASGIIF